MGSVALGAQVRRPHGTTNPRKSARSAVALGANRTRRYRLPDETLRHRFDKGVPAAHIDMARRSAPASENLMQQLAIEAPLEVAGAVPRFPGRGQHQLETGREGLRTQQLVAIREIVPGARRVDEERRRVGRRRGAMAQHRDQWDDAGAARDQQQRAAILGSPHEMAADGAAYLERTP